jgi:hypothetical protein
VSIASKLVQTPYITKFCNGGGTSKFRAHRTCNDRVVIGDELYAAKQRAAIEQYEHDPLATPPTFDLQGWVETNGVTRASGFTLDVVTAASLETLHDQLAGKVLVFSPPDWRPPSLPE